MINGEISLIPMLQGFLISLILAKSNFNQRLDAGRPFRRHASTGDFHLRKASTVLLDVIDLWLLVFSDLAQSSQAPISDAIFHAGFRFAPLFRLH
jgi:hypothetical protein